MINKEFSSIVDNVLYWKQVIGRYYIVLDFHIL